MWSKGGLNRKSTKISDHASDNSGNTLYVFYLKWQNYKWDTHITQTSGENKRKIT
jgi:hypothetical protein